MFKSVLAAAIAILLAAPQIAGAQVAPPTKAASSEAASPDTILPRAYCRATGGTAQVRIAEFGTNGGTPLILANPRDFCEYVSKDGTTHIDVLLTTLVTTKPSLAALAYYSKTHINLKTCAGGPGSCYCSLIGGTDEFGGVNAAGGGWVLNSNVNDVLDVCVFPDLSAIDAYGLYYHAYGAIRGRRLDHLLRYPDPY